ncbi:SMP-30/gluconolactonase/LRE family protein [Celeribacter baekdonensis]|uniref:SMP-30/gluconolactonase/LRE family protein n=1 Tax=Celeribacter baekdonensis TaxID=875171 RepID=UPI0030DB738F|tara:strand:- start:295952 stop:296800 length:849 start_codon:yes stop_codon:yes gene_type:complete
MRAQAFDPRPCVLGEGPLWHPQRQELFWFDIIACRLLARQGEITRMWQFDEHHSAAGWVDHDTLLIASETGLWRFNIETGQRDLVAPLEADRPETRSNDGRADRQGGFWIGTMGKHAEPGLGAIYRFYKGEVVRLFDGLTIPNAICFAPDGRMAYYACTKTGQINRQPLDAAGWPVGAPEVFLDLNDAGLNPDGAVVDAEGGIWNAQWGAGRVARYLPDGTFDRAISVGGVHSSCPAFGGPDLNTLFVTTAREDILAPDAAQGVVYACDAGVKGLQEPHILL